MCIVYGDYTDVLYCISVDMEMNYNGEMRSEQKKPLIPSQVYEMSQSSINKIETNIFSMVSEILNATTKDLHNQTKHNDDFKSLCSKIAVL